MRTVSYSGLRHWKKLYLRGKSPPLPVRTNSLVSKIAVIRQLTKILTAEISWERGIIVTATAIFLETLDPESTEFTGRNEMKAPRKLHDTITARAAR